MSHDIRTPLNAVLGMTELGRDPTLISALNDSEETAVTAVSAVYDRLEELLDKGHTDPAVNAEYPADNYDGAILRFLAREDQLDTIASVKGVPSAAKADTDERYASVRAPEKVEAGYVNTGNVLNHMKDYFRNEAGRLGTGETATAEQAARSYVRRCAEVAAAMAESGNGIRQLKK